MTAGLNLRCTVWRITDDQDDSVGGALMTGTAVNTGVPLRLQPKRASQLLLQQGLETVRTFTGILVPGDVTLWERDELEVTFPPTHQYYGNRFRVVGLMYDDAVKESPKSVVFVDLTRVVRAHVQQ